MAYGYQGGLTYSEAKELTFEEIEIAVTTLKRIQQQIKRSLPNGK